MTKDTISIKIKELGEIINDIDFNTNGLYILLNTNIYNDARIEIGNEEIVEVVLISNNKNIAIIDEQSSYDVIQLFLVTRKNDSYLIRGINSALDSIDIKPIVNTSNILTEIIENIKTLYSGDIQSFIFIKDFSKIVYNQIKHLLYSDNSIYIRISDINKKLKTNKASLINVNEYFSPTDSEWVYKIPDYRLLDKRLYMGVCRKVSNFDKSVFTFNPLNFHCEFYLWCNDKKIYDNAIDIFPERDDFIINISNDQNISLNCLKKQEICNTSFTYFDVYNIFNDCEIDIIQTEDNPKCKLLDDIINEDKRYMLFSEGVIKEAFISFRYKKENYLYLNLIFSKYKNKSSSGEYLWVEVIYHKENEIIKCTGRNIDVLINTNTSIEYMSGVINPYNKVFINMKLSKSMIFNKYIDNNNFEIDLEPNGEMVTSINECIKMGVKDYRNICNSNCSIKSFVSKTPWKSFSLSNNNSNILYRLAKESNFKLIENNICDMFIVLINKYKFDNGITLEYDSSISILCSLQLLHTAKSKLFALEIYSPYANINDFRDTSNIKRFVLCNSASYSDELLYNKIKSVLNDELFGYLTPFSEFYVFSLDIFKSFEYACIKPRQIQK